MQQPTEPSPKVVGAFVAMYHEYLDTPYDPVTDQTLAYLLVTTWPTLGQKARGVISQMPKLVFELRSLQGQKREAAHNYWRQFFNVVRGSLGPPDLNYKTTLFRDSMLFIQ